MEEYGEYFDDLGSVITPCFSDQTFLVNRYLNIEIAFYYRNDRVGCKVTKKIIAKDPDDLRRHIEGKKFKAAMERGVSLPFYL